MPQIEQEGYFRVFPVESGLRKGTADGAKSLGASFKFRIMEIWHEDQWCDYSEHQLETEGVFWFRTKDGSANENAVKSLAQAFGWNGSPSFFETTDLTSKGAVVQVKGEVYKEKTRYKASWLYPYDHIPQSGVSNVSEDEAKQLDTECGATFRALIAASGANAQPSAAAPAPPAPAATGAPF